MCTIVGSLQLQNVSNAGDSTLLYFLYGLAIFASPLQEECGYWICSRRSRRRAGGARYPSGACANNRSGTIWAILPGKIPAERLQTVSCWARFATSLLSWLNVRIVQLSGGWLSLLCDLDMGFNTCTYDFYYPFVSLVVCPHQEHHSALWSKGMEKLLPFSNLFDLIFLWFCSYCCLTWLSC